MSSQPAGEELPYIGSKISLISSSDIRYEGILDSIDPVASTVSLRYVQSFGTESRPVALHIPPSAEIFNCIVFRGKHIKDLTVCSEPEPPAPPVAAYPHDPAILSMEMAGPLGAPQRPGGSSLLRPGLGSPPSHVGRAPSGGPPPVYGGLGGAPNEMAEACCPPAAALQGRGVCGAPGQPQAHAAEGLAPVAAAQQQDKQQQQQQQQQTPPSTRGRGGAGGPRGGPRQGPRGRGPRPEARGEGPPGPQGPRGPRDNAGRGYSEGPRGVVGELQGRPNAQLRSEVAEEFDFDAMNSKFEKPANLEEASELLSSGAAYDKNVSFFDSISCEALEKRSAAARQQQQQQQQPNAGNGQDERSRRTAIRQQNRALDVDTFGEGAARFSVRHFGGRRGGRGRGRGSYGRGGPPGGPGGAPQNNRGSKNGAAAAAAARTLNQSNKQQDVED